MGRILVLVVGLVASIAGRHFLASEPFEHIAVTQMAAQVSPYQAPKPMDARGGFLRRHCGTYLTQSSGRFRHAADWTYAQGLPRLDRAWGPPTHPAGVIARTRALAGRPYGVAVARDGTTYVALIGTNSLRRGDLRSGDFTASVNVGSTPPHVVINPTGTRAYATLQTGRGIAVVDVAANALLATVPLTSDGFNLALTPTGDRVYATTAAGTLYVLDAVNYAVLDTLNVGPAANGLAFSPDQCTLYVTSRDAGTVTAVSTSSHTITRTYHIGGMPQRIAVAPDGSEIYIANEQAGLNVVDVESGAVSSVSFGTAAYGLGLTPDAEQLYVLLPATGEVRILDRATRGPIKAVLVGGTPRNVTFDPLGTTALVTTEEAVVFIQ
jgi:DNA-binding beta-propeller fold protein YncE